MFGAAMNPLNAYRTVGVQTAVPGSDPHQLVVLLFEGGKQALIIARAAMADGNVAQKGEAITKAIDIILNGLKASLNLSEGGPLADNLAALYDYMARRLLHATAKNDLGALDEVTALFSEIQGAWIEIADKIKQAPAQRAGAQ